MTHSILLCGVGGQGILLAAKIIGTAAGRAGLEVCTHEIHGMAQRGGSVRAQIKFGGKVHSPLILEGTASVLASLERIEALRCAHFLRPGGLAVVSKQSIVPVTVSSGLATYPADVDDRLVRTFPKLKLFDCASKAVEMGDARLANTILVGMLSTGLPLDEALWNEAISACVKPAFRDANLAAFAFGRSL
ncbi:MAG: indolepyruvate oxidoreductase subunit beta [Kiritimatiellia bacterium]